MTTCTLQVNERGSWRNVISFTDDFDIEAVKVGVNLLAIALGQYKWRIAETGGEIVWLMEAPSNGSTVIGWLWRPYRKQSEC